MADLGKIFFDDGRVESIFSIDGENSFNLVWIAQYVHRK